MRNLRKQRKAAGLTQVGLARLARTPRWKLAFTESGRKVYLTPAEQGRIKQALFERISRNVEELEQAAFREHLAEPAASGRT